ncbi:MAG: hypothetical protein ACOYPR_04885 [Saprospiraceae bacterium]
MKNLLTFTAVIAFSFTAAAQNCYVRLDDASGYTPTASQLAELEAAACRLIDSLPAEFQDSFKVYDFGFYLHNETQQGGYPEAFQWAVDTVQTLSKYYLLFGKQTDRSGVYTRFWVDLKLPETGIFSCLDENEWNFLELNLELTLNIYHHQFQSGQYYFHSSELEGIASVLAFVEKQQECCFQGAKMTCEIPCLENKKIKTYLESNGFRKISIKILDLPSAKNKNDKLKINKSVQIIDSANMAIEINGEQIYFENMFIEMSNLGLFTFKGIVTSNNNFCSSTDFKEIENQFINSNNFKAAIWYHIYKDEFEGDYLYIKWHEYGKDSSNIFGLEILFSQVNLPNNEPGYQNGNKRIVQIDKNGFIISISPHRDVLSPKNCFQTPIIRTPYVLPPVYRYQSKVEMLVVTNHQKCTTKLH